MDASTTLAEIVTARPGVARILGHHDLDFCCGGGATLAEACAAAGLDPADILAELAETPDEPRPDWADLAPGPLTEHLVATHHAFLWSEMPRLLRLARKVADVHGDRHPELAEVAALVDTFVQEMQDHLTKEERVLFPMVRELTTATHAPEFHCGSLQNPIRVMLMEHDQAGEQLARLRELTGGYQVPADGCASYQALYEGLAELEADTHLHVHKENNVLFPAVVAAEGALAGT